VRVADVAERFAVPGSWQFSPEVAAVFDEHVEASVPFYQPIQELAAEVADWAAPAGATIADLGAATGTTCERIQRRHPDRGYTFHLYDAAEEMLDRARGKLVGAKVLPTQILSYQQRLEAGLRHSFASLTLALFTLQFLDPTDRHAVLQMARGCARDEGALLVAEKLRLPDSRWHEIAAAVSHDWKAARGIGHEAIRAKERALRGVLVPLTDDQNRRMITAAGWAGVEVLFRWHSWAVYGAFAS
jgi:tRNA (cmo5U34)-methyltransferase